MLKTDFMWVRQTLGQNNLGLMLDDVGAFMPALEKIEIDIVKLNV